MSLPADCAELAIYTLRERQIILGLLAGHPVRHIAASLGVAQNTVRTYVKAIYVKAQVHSVRELMLKYLPGIGAFRLQRVDSLKSLLAATGIFQLHAATLTMFRAWTGARRVLCWEIRGPAAAILVTSPQVRSVLLPAPVPGRAPDPVLISATHAWQEPLLRTAAAGHPFQGELLLLRLRLLRRSWLVALADPPAGGFAPDAASIVRALSRIAGHQAESVEPRKPLAAPLQPAVSNQA